MTWISSSAAYWKTNKWHMVVEDHGGKAYTKCHRDLYDHQGLKRQTRTPDLDDQCQQCKEAAS